MYDVAPWLSVVIGACALVVFGIALLAGFDLAVRTPQARQGGRTGGLGSMALFGVSYAVGVDRLRAAAVPRRHAGVFGRTSLRGGVLRCVRARLRGRARGALTVALALARQSMVHTVRRRVLPFVNRIAGGLLVVTGAYVAWYGWVEIRGTADDPTVTGSPTGPPAWRSWSSGATGQYSPSPSPPRSPSASPSAFVRTRP